jgi:tRNA U34 5-methylaminomethyl-2-thiouridine-forming methyltransferase MnmC
MGRFETQICTDGSVTLKDLDLGEAMHSTLGPYAEAMALYIEQSRLSERLQTGSHPLVVYDIGLGIATNALAAIDHSAGPRPLHLYSFESKLDGLALALKMRDQFPCLLPHAGKLETLLERHSWSSGSSGKIRWQLLEGRFEDVALPVERPELVFFDFYSPKTSPELWTHQVFKRLRDHAAQPCTLYTYSASTAVRSALLMAGWEVGYGVSTSAKRETTVASTDRRELQRPLDDRWVHRFLHSTHSLPSDRGSESDRREVLKRLRARSTV